MKVLKVFLLTVSDVGCRKTLFAVKAVTEHGEVVLKAPTVEALEAFCKASVGDCTLDTSEV